MKRLATLAVPPCADLLKIVYIIASYNYLTAYIANIDSYGNKSFSELHAM